MGRALDAIDDVFRALIEAQRMFFVATAPLDAGGHVNLSPKGLDTFRILDTRTVAYLDLVGSGAETIAHLRENGRIAIMRQKNRLSVDGLPALRWVEAGDE